jgi:hypothetical protein
VPQESPGARARPGIQTAQRDRDAHLTLTNSAFPLAIVCLLRIDPAPEADARAGGIGLAVVPVPSAGSTRIVRRGRSFRFEAARCLSLPLRIVESAALGTGSNGCRGRAQPRGGPGHRASAAHDPDPVRGSGGWCGADSARSTTRSSTVTSLGALITRICSGRSVASERTTGRSRPIPPIGFDYATPRSVAAARDSARLAAFVAREMIVRAPAPGARRVVADSVPGTESRCRIGAVVLDTEQTDALLRAARRRRTTINGVVAAALLLAELDADPAGRRCRSMQSSGSLSDRT